MKKRPFSEEKKLQKAQKARKSSANQPSRAPYTDRREALTPHLGERKKMLQLQLR